MRTVLFHRDFQGFQGGHLKVFHYFEHVLASPEHEPRIHFTEASAWTSPTPGTRTATRWSARAAPRAPVINLIQHPRHAEPQDPRHAFLGHPAIRICVSEEVRDAIVAGGAAQGPVLTIPVALDLDKLPAPRHRADRDLACLVVAVKGPALGAAVAARIAAAGHQVRLVDRRIPRGELLDAMARSRVSVHVPRRGEGAYLPALESMALECAVVCPDCVGNRSFARHGDTCLMPAWSEEALAAAACEALEAPEETVGPMLARAREQARERDLAGERARFQSVLEATDELWRPR